MIYQFVLPLINPHMSGARVECIYAQPGAALAMGSKLFDISVDLGSAFAQECPPISFFRIVLRERLYLRRLDVTDGQLCAVGDLMALFSVEPEQDLSAPPARPIRVSTAGILSHAQMWTEKQR